MPRRGSSARGRVAFVATTGGHLVQLDLMAPVLEPERYEDAVWITHASDQSRSLLAGRDVVFVPMVHARRVHQAIARTPAVLRELRRRGVDTAYSTGAALALAALPLSRAVGARPVFIESLARPEAPSRTGSILQRMPWVDCWTQYPQNADRRWSHRSSLLEGYESVDEPVGGAGPLRVLVSLGTAGPWGFRRLVERLLEILPADWEVVWQTGVTDVADLPISARAFMPAAELQEEIGNADVVVSHAGVGSLLTSLREGKAPLLVPRRVAHGEHVDDHQTQIARVAADRGLALHREADEISLEDLRLLARRRVRRRPLAAPRGL